MGDYVKVVFVVRTQDSFQSRLPVEPVALPFEFRDGVHNVQGIKGCGCEIDQYAVYVTVKTPWLLESDFFRGRGHEIPREMRQ
jgi:hypothetical protein